jgi:hypothetical protein
MPGGKRRIKLPNGVEIEAEVIGFRSNAEHWNEYLLDDHTVVRLKPVVTEILRVEGQYDANGNPAYMIQSTNVTAVDAPEELRRQGGF